MTHIPHILIEDYGYELPPEKIPSSPLSERDLSKLLVYRKGEISECVFNQLPNLLPPSTNLIVNNTKVFPARLNFYNKTGAKIEVFCLQPFESVELPHHALKARWEVLVGNLKKWHKTDILSLEIDQLLLEVALIENKGEYCLVDFFWNSSHSIYEILEKLAELPLPPYMNRKATKDDKIRYQTVYAHQQGSVAAPTAGLHFTEQVFKALNEKSIQINPLTLHVGAGTFKPVKAKEIAGHEMHSEYFEVSIELIQSLIDRPHVIGVGTTSVRVLESLYWIGVDMITTDTKYSNANVSQWVAYQSTSSISTREALNAIISSLTHLKVNQLSGRTSIIIVPGFEFKICRGMVTNFHQPNSTLILLVAAFIGKDWEKVYQYALSNQFRFLSYGDSSLLLP